MNDSPKLKRYLLQLLLTVLAILLCLLKDPSAVVGISSFGLIALVISFVLLMIFGLQHYQFSFDVSYLWPLSLKDFLNNFGVLVYSLGFTLFLLSQIVWVHACVPCRSLCSAEDVARLSKQFRFP